MGIAQLNGKLNLETPQAQQRAIDAIGYLTTFWRLYVDELRAGRPGNEPKTRREALLVSPDGAVEVYSSSERARKEAKKLGRNTKLYNSHILMRGWNSSEFYYYPNKETLFPFSVKTDRGSEVYITREVFGIPEKLDRSTLKYWHQLWEATDNLYHQSTLDVFNSGELRHPESAIIDSIVDNGEKISDFRIYIASNAYYSNPEDQERALGELFQLVGAQMRERIMNEGDNSLVFQSANSLATGFEQIYQLSINSQV